MIDADSGGFDWTPALLRTIRLRRNRRRALLVTAGIVGLGLAWLHWLGLTAGGAFIGLVSRTIPRAVGAALAFGLLTVALSILSVPAITLTELLGLTPLSYLTVTTAIIAPVWGALIRLVV